MGGKAKLAVKNVANLQNHQADGGRGRHGPGGGPAAHAGQSEYPGSQAPQTGQPNKHSREFSYGRKEVLFGEKNSHIGNTYAMNYSTLHETLRTAQSHAAFVS